MIKCPGSRWTLDLNLEGLIQSRTIGEVPWPIAKKVRCYLPVKEYRYHLTMDKRLFSLVDNQLRDIEFDINISRTVLACSKAACTRNGYPRGPVIQTRRQFVYDDITIGAVTIAIALSLLWYQSKISLPAWPYRSIATK